MNAYALAAWLCGFFIVLGITVEYFQDLGFWLSMGTTLIAMTFLVLAINEAFGGDARGVVRYLRERKRLPRQYRGRRAR